MQQVRTSRRRAYACHFEAARGRGRARARMKGARAAAVCQETRRRRRRTVSRHLLFLPPSPPGSGAKR